MPDVTPIRIGHLQDFRRDGESDEISSLLCSGPAPKNVRNAAALYLRFQEAYESGELRRPVEILARPVYGLPGPMGSQKAIEDAWYELADEGVLAIVGPAITDNATIAKPLAEENRLPTINMCGSAETQGEFNFQVHMGSLPDEATYMARLVKQLGHERCAVIRESSVIGAGYYDYFSMEAERIGLTVTSDQRIDPLETNYDPQISAARNSGAEMLVYLAFGLGCKPVSDALKRADWDPPRVGTTALAFGYGRPEVAEALEGWFAADLYDTRNPYYQSLVERYEAFFGGPMRPTECAIYDAASLLVEALRRAPLLSRESVKDGLERVRALPAAMGGIGTVMGFAPFDRVAHKGPDHIMFMQIKGGRFIPYEDYRSA